MNFGITLSNRGVLVGLCSARDLLKLADAVEASPLMDSVWCGDALFVNRRLDAPTLLAALAGPPQRGRLRRAASACPRRGPPRAGPAGAGLHGLVRAPRSDGVRL